MTRPFFFVVLLSASALACSSSTTGSGNASSSSSSSGGTTALAANCESRCEAKATECKAPDPAETCASICAKQPTESQATCLENSSCDTLASSAAPCGIGTSSSSSSSSGGSTSSSSGSTSSKTDPPGSPCGSANNGVNDCAPIGCKCTDGYSSFPASVCTNGSCAGKSDFCPGVCKDHGGWTGS